jgi:hypothetical protein
MPIHALHGQKVTTARENAMIFTEVYLLILLSEDEIHISSFDIIAATDLTT